MFSFFLHNPNDLKIIPDSNYNVVPFGHRCSSALVCKYASLRNFSLPFDWTIPLFPQKIKEVLQNDFQEFVPDVHNNVFENKYAIILSHFNSDKESGIEEYNRRIERFSNIMKESKKKYFVYINEDYLYDPTYREEGFNHSIFSQMLELETFLKEKYENLDYNILYFNFMQHDIPPSSNIINIVLHANTIYDSFIPEYAEQFRNYCGEVLTQLFHTQLQLGYSHETFLG
jgi:hypothetical protein